MANITEARTASQKRTTAGSSPAQVTPQAAGDRTPAPTPAARTSPETTPFAFMRRFAEEMEHLFEDFGMSQGLGVPRLVSRGRELLRREAGIIPGDWSPKVDVLERDGLFVVRADLPGMSKDDVQVDIKGDMLTIQGERNYKKEEDREGGFYSECSYGRFYRAIPLPEDAHAEEASASFRDGVLEVKMPAPPRQEFQTRRLEVRDGA